MNEMLTRWEVLMQLRKMEGRSLSQIKRDCREFEEYMAANYDYVIVKGRAKTSGEQFREPHRPGSSQVAKPLRGYLCLGKEKNNDQ